MGLTITRAGDWFQNAGDRSRAVVTIAFDSSYPTGGESLTPADLALSEVSDVRIDSKGGYTFEYDYANKKVKAFVEEGVAAGGPLLEVADLANLATVTGVLVVATGR